MVLGFELRDKYLLVGVLYYLSHTPSTQFLIFWS
jgi:hypothetical protein